MKRKKDKLIEELTNVFLDFKKIKIQAITSCEEVTHSEKMVLCILKDISKDSIALLSELRDKIKLAPSTITPVITLLEKKRLIERHIDKSDRRNIYIKITSHGKDLTSKIKIEMMEELNRYIEYMGFEDTEQLIKLFKKTARFFSRKDEK